MYTEKFSSCINFFVKFCHVRNCRNSKQMCVLRCFLLFSLQNIIIIRNLLINVLYYYFQTINLNKILCRFYLNINFSLFSFFLYLLYSYYTYAVPYLYLSFIFV